MDGGRKCVRGGLEDFNLSVVFYCCLASVVPFRKDHMEKCFNAMLSCRASSPIDFDAEKVVIPDMDDSDVKLCSKFIVKSVRLSLSVAVQQVSL